MATEDDDLESYAKIQEQQLKAQIVELKASSTIECVDCGEPIPQARKQAAPWAIRCIDCEEEYSRWLK